MIFFVNKTSNIPSQGLYLSTPVMSYMILANACSPFGLVNAAIHAVLDSMVSLHASQYWHYEFLLTLFLHSKLHRLLLFKSARSVLSNEPIFAMFRSMFVDKYDKIRIYTVDLALSGWFVFSRALGQPLALCPFYKGLPIFSSSFSSSFLFFMFLSSVYVSPR